MTAQQKSAIRVGVITTVIAGLSLLALSGLSGQVVLRPEFDAHVQSDTAWKREQKELTLEVLCSPGVNPASRRCR